MGSSRNESYKTGMHSSSTLHLKTGLHIGGGGETLDIGGIDKPVIRDPLTRQPYLPGSSIKGKLRAILERLLEKPLNRKGSRDTFRYESDDLSHGFTDVNGQPTIPFEGAASCQISRLFGSTGVRCWILRSIAEAEELDKVSPEVIRKQHPLIEGEQEFVKVVGRNSPARLIVRDCHLVQASAEKLKRIDTGLYMTEWKFENGLDRVTAAANPRQIERVPAGSQFQFELVYTVENIAQVQEDIKNLALAIAILEDDALGGHGSRGYGKIEFQNFELSYHDYRNLLQTTESGMTFSREPLSKANTKELLKDLVKCKACCQGAHNR
ncbi:MAG: type III-A CRISPR-associated RAMP protein Csm3 [Cyanobacteria bacterium CRU_2_1]|nr:type III-A CRISPR-associated RAMP protein Csm3 [Cyanobacteria bacterium CRU_2_1]